MSAALQCFVAMQPIDGEAKRGAETGGQAAPPASVTNSQMPFVTAEEFVRPLTDQRDFDILARASRDEIHRNNGRSCNGLLQTFHDLWKRSFEFGPVKLYRDMTSTQKSGRLLCIGQLVVFEGLSITYRVSWPGTALFIHQRQEQARVKSAA